MGTNPSTSGEVESYTTKNLEKYWRVGGHFASPLRNQQASANKERLKRGVPKITTSAPPPRSTRNCSWELSIQFLCPIYILTEKNLIINIWRKADTLKEPKQRPSEAIRA